MMQQQLATIIQRIQMESRSGLLIVKRGKESNKEEGTILFINGKMEEARAGRRTKFDAFKYLCTWEQYEFSFNAPDGRTLLFSSPSPAPKAYQLPPSTPSIPLARLSTPLQLKPAMVEKETPESTVLIPHHSRKRLAEGLQVIEKMGLTRGHRRLFLLINGERSVVELARLTASNKDELCQRLHDLEDAAVVYMLEKA
jgi:hypothetical protein